MKIRELGISISSELDKRIDFKHSLTAVSIMCKKKIFLRKFIEYAQFFITVLLGLMNFLTGFLSYKGYLLA